MNIKNPFRSQPTLYFLVYITVVGFVLLQFSATSAQGVADGLSGLLGGLLGGSGGEDAAATPSDKPVAAKPKPSKRPKPTGGGGAAARPTTTRAPGRATRKPSAIKGKPTTTQTPLTPPAPPGEATNATSASRCHYLGNAPTPLAVVTAPAAKNRTPKIIAATLPWNVLVLSKRTGHYCAAMAVNNMWVLTAAHCLKGDAETVVRDVWFAVPGISHYVVDPDGVMPDSAVQISSAVVHPQFSYQSDFTPDLALLKLSAPLKSIVPACVADTLPKDSDSKANLARKCVVYGWEKSTEQANNRTLSMILVEPDSNATCSKSLSAIYGRGVYDSTRSICVAAPETKLAKDYCISTAGTGLLCNADSSDKTTWTLEGLFAYGNMCLGKDYQGVFVRTAVKSLFLPQSTYRHWIQETTTI